MDKWGMLGKNAEVLLPKPEMRTGEIQPEWEMPVKEGPVWIRLTATDIAGNTSSETIQVEVTTAVATRALFLPMTSKQNSISHRIH